MKNDNGTRKIFRTVPNFPSCSEENLPMSERILIYIYAQPRGLYPPLKGARARRWWWQWCLQLVICAWQVTADRLHHSTVPVPGCSRAGAVAVVDFSALNPQQRLQ